VDLEASWTANVLGVLANYIENFEGRVGAYLLRGDTYRTMDKGVCGIPRRLGTSGCVITFGGIINILFRTSSAYVCPFWYLQMS
jgi:hypothetical protein